MGFGWVGNGNGNGSRMDGGLGCTGLGGWIRMVEQGEGEGEGMNRSYRNGKSSLFSARLVWTWPVDSLNLVGLWNMGIVMVMVTGDWIFVRCQLDR